MQGNNIGYEIHVFININEPLFAILKSDIEAHPRQCGEYIIGLISIRELRQQDLPLEAILEQVIDHFDNDTRERDPNFVPNHGWVDYETDLETARLHTVEALVGGTTIGQVVQTMREPMARRYFDRFVEACGPNPRYFIRLGIGAPSVFNHGVLVVADELAGILWINEGD